MRVRKRREEIVWSANQTIKAFQADKAKRGNFYDLKADLLDEK